MQYGRTHRTISLPTRCTVPLTHHPRQLQDAMSGAQMPPDGIPHFRRDLSAPEPLALLAHTLQAGDDPAEQHRSFLFAKYGRYLDHCPAHGVLLSIPCKSQTIC